MKKIMKRTLSTVTFFTFISVITAVAENRENLQSDPQQDKWASLVNETPYQTVVQGNTLIYGSHTYTVEGHIEDPGPTGYRGEPTAFVSFTHIPSGYTEFEAVYNGLLGKSIQGTAAMIPMAIEIFARNNETGEKCFQLICNSQTTVSSILRILKTKLKPSPYAAANDSYLQRYMAAALLKGATATNAYTPVQPFTVEMVASVNKPQAVTGGTDTFVYILAKGWDTQQRSVEVFQANGSDYFKVYNCPSTYTQCKNIVGEWQGLK